MPLAEGLAPGPHTVTVQKRTEAEQGRTTLYGIEADGALLDLPPAPSRLIEFIGDSHTCGYGTEGKTGLGAFHPRDRELRPGMGLHRGALFRCRLRAHGPFGAGIVRNWGR